VIATELGPRTGNPADAGRAVKSVGSHPQHTPWLQLDCGDPCHYIINSGNLWRVCFNETTNTEINCSIGVINIKPFRFWWSFVSTILRLKLSFDRHKYPVTYQSFDVYFIFFRYLLTMKRIAQKFAVRSVPQWEAVHSERFNIRFSLHSRDNFCLNRIPSHSLFWYIC